MATTELIRRPITETLAGLRDAAPPPDANSPALLGDGVAVRHLRSQIQRIAPYFRIAVLRGESGSGKGVVARAIHARSPGALGPFIIADAAVFADAVSAAPGPRSTPSLLEAADGGTLYLKRACDLSAAHQDSLVRFFRGRWERRAESPSGSDSPERRTLERRQPNPAPARYCGMRILVASDRDLRTLAAVGRFRQDLYAQLSAVEIVVPPLRERLDDIPVLATWLLRWIEQQTGQSPKHFSHCALAHLHQLQWPRNLRELEEVVAQAAALSPASLIELPSLLALGEPATIAPAPSAPPRIERLDEVVQRHVVDVLTRCGGNKLRTAELLGISRSTLYRMLDSNADSMSALPG
jgi:DNA-binding NtrC family response regulator